MNYLACTAIGYTFGCVSPSYFISQFMKKDIRKSGTGNLGATNTLFHFGRKWGVMVMLFDVFKAFISVKLCQWMFPAFLLSGIIAGTAAVIGHIFPFYLNFRGGKGLACLGGFILAINWKYFLILLFIGFVLSIIVNYACCTPFSAAILFPIMYSVETKSLSVLFVLMICSAGIVYSHMDNVYKIRRGEELSVRDFLYYTFLKKSKERTKEES